MFSVDALTTHELCLVAGAAAILAVVVALLIAIVVYRTSRRAAPITIEPFPQTDPSLLQEKRSRSFHLTSAASNSTIIPPENLPRVESRLQSNAPFENSFVETLQRPSVFNNAYLQHNSTQSSLFGQGSISHQPSHGSFTSLSKA